MLISIPETKCAHLLDLTRRLLTGSPVTSGKELHSYAGKLSFAAGLVPTLEPFSSGLWAVVAAPNTSEGPSRRLRRVARLPSELVHIRLCSHLLSWLSAFFADRASGVSLWAPAKVG